MDILIPLTAIVMIFSVPLVAILTTHVRKSKKIQAEIIKDQLELERVKQQNYLLETEKLRLELEKMKEKDYHEIQNNKNDLNI
ncbi:hypothetical protein [Pallidibacillus pasinlerensis]|uniref:Uncharacterized protein n=1 Tax=Pallidibacillus pasinlerensis TaxID=2703818 RepID=A0ABX0A5H7_9BACI|nr:hypothetical protein [Pallidibacillus pasinlerensis]NCU17766.1 hypothetical protein [Pallidibacillus pasinlerensis]